MTVLMSYILLSSTQCHTYVLLSLSIYCVNEFTYNDIYLYMYNLSNDIFCCTFRQFLIRLIHIPGKEVQLKQMQWNISEIILFTYFHFSLVKIHKYLQYCLYAGILTNCLFFKIGVLIRLWSMDNPWVHKGFSHFDIGL